MGLGSQRKLFLQSIPQILHLGEIAAFVVFDDALEYIDVQKRLDLSLTFRFWSRSVHDFMAQIRQRYGVSISGSDRKAVVSRSSRQVEPCVASPSSYCLAKFIGFPWI